MSAQFTINKEFARIYEKNIKKLNNIWIDKKYILCFQIVHVLHKLDYSMLQLPFNEIAYFFGAFKNNYILIF